MAIRCTNPNKVIDYILEHEQENKEEFPTIFGIRAETGADRSEDTAGMMSAHKTIKKSRNKTEFVFDPDKIEKLTLDKFCRIVKYVKNYSVENSATGDWELKDFDTPEGIEFVAKTIPPELREEVLTALSYEYTLTEGEKKS